MKVPSFLISLCKMTLRQGPSCTCKRLGGAALLSLAAVTLAGCTSSKTLGSSVDDFTAAQSIRSTLFTDRSRDYGDVDITIYDGRLMLTGTMRSEEGRQKLVANAWRAENIRQVVDEIVIGEKTGFGQGVADSRIDQTINAKYLTDRGVSGNDYKIAVSNRVVYIIGVARDQIELDRALNYARSTSGVKKVVSHVVYRDADAPRRN
ncbi:MAG: BON domain-containing protein [Pseudomonadota bacterium]